MHNTPLIGPYHPDDVLAWEQDGPRTALNSCLTSLDSPSCCPIGPRFSISRPAVTSFWWDLPPRFYGVS